MTAHTRSFEDMVLAAPTQLLARGSVSVAPSRRRSKDASPEYWIVFAVCFMVFVAALICERLLPRRFRKISEQLGARNVLAEAQAAAHRYTAIAFQG